MATTTNYGWTTPDDTALVKDGAAAIRTLGSSVDTTTKNLNPSTTLGDIEYRSSTANVNTRLGIGSTGNVLTVSGGVPVWSAPAGGGKVLQVVSTTYSTGFSTSTDSFSDTGLTLNITPSSATSKVLILVTQNGCYKNANNSTNGFEIELLRGGTSLIQFAQSSGYTASALWNVIGSASCEFLDAPATTSATTYKTRMRNDVSGSAVGCQYDGATSTIVLLEIGA
jgi:hypothetical protein